MLGQFAGAATPWDYLSDIAVMFVWTCCGLAAWRLRPASRIGPLMVLIGLLYAVAVPKAVKLHTDLAGRSLITTVGELSYWLLPALIAHVLITYPSGRAARADQRILLAAAYPAAVTGAVGALLFRYSDRSGCADRCEISPIAIPNSHAAQVVVATLTLWLQVGLAGWTLVVLIRRFRSCSPRERNAVGLSFLVAAIVLAVAALNYLIDAINLGRNASQLIIVAVYLDVIAVPVAFLAGLLREKLAYAAVADLIRDLGSVEPDHIQTALAKVLHDPTLQVAFPHGAQGGLVDIDGHRLDPNDRGQLAATVLGRAHQPLAVLLHDPHLADQPDLLDAVAAAARLALENARLQAEVRAQLADVKDSRARLIDVADQERRKIERNLHDGAQQRLLGMGMTLRMLRNRLTNDDPETASLIDEADEELRTALRELRDLAQGIHPAVLTDEGLPAALGMLARHSPLPVVVEGELSHRLPATIEATAYYIASEALQNVVKHAHATRAIIRLHDDNTHLTIQVADDGVGGATLADGTGLRGLSDRVHSANGELSILSPPKEGTTITAHLPDHGAINRPITDER